MIARLTWGSLVILCCNLGNLVVILTTENNDLVDNKD